MWRETRGRRLPLVSSNELEIAYFIIIDIKSLKIFKITLLGGINIIKKYFKIVTIVNINVGN